MKQSHNHQYSTPLNTLATEDSQPVLTRFGDTVDVRRRGALRLGRFAGSQTPRTMDAPAVVRLWRADECREMTSHQARALAAQLLEAATLADTQNNFENILN